MRIPAHALRRTDPWAVCAELARDHTTVRASPSTGGVPTPSRRVGAARIAADDVVKPSTIGCVQRWVGKADTPSAECGDEGPERRVHRRDRARSTGGAQPYDREHGPASD